MMKLDAFQVANQGATHKLRAKKMRDSYLASSEQGKNKEADLQ
jgi:hypothetical protein